MHRKTKRRRRHRCGNEAQRLVMRAIVIVLERRMRCGCGCIWDAMLGGCRREGQRRLRGAAVQVVAEWRDEKRKGWAGEMRRGRLSGAGYS